MDYLSVTDEQVLLIHLGGLGDVCLSESSFFSCSIAFSRRMMALGYARFLGLFREYFSTVHSVEERRWLTLFSDEAPRRTWQRIILIGKDRTGDIRRRLTPLSRDPLLFIEMYPDEELIHVEKYQLRQLEASAIKGVRKEITPRRAYRAILYPEESRGKQKWPRGRFQALAEILNAKGVNTVLLEAPDANHPLDGSLRFEGLDEIAAFFSGGGVFFSNDSGVAHLAGACGLTTITLFYDQSPTIWHPRGQNLSIVCGGQYPDPEYAAALIQRVLESHNE